MRSLLSESISGHNFFFDVTFAGSLLSEFYGMVNGRHAWCFVAIKGNSTNTCNHVFSVLFFFLLKQ